MARQQLEAAISAAEQHPGGSGGSGGTASSLQELASYRLKLAQAYWALGGELRAGRGAGAHAALLASAAVDGPHQGEAFCWLGRWYGDVAGDAARATKCYQRALALDPTQVWVGGLAGFMPLTLRIGDQSAVGVRG